MITRLEAYYYRCFPALAIDLGPYHVLAGANGAGKTTLLDVSVLIGDMMRQQRVVAAFLERHEAGQAPRTTTLTDLLHKGTGETVSFAFEAKLPADVLNVFESFGRGCPNRPISTHLRYELRLEVTARSLSASDEYLFLFGEESHPAVVTGLSRRRQQPHLSMGCHQFDFDSREGIVVAPTKDPGAFKNARELLSFYEPSHDRAVVMIDADWKGSSGAAAIRKHLEESHCETWSEFPVIVIEPELEA